MTAPGSPAALQSSRPRSRSSSRSLREALAAGGFLLPSMALLGLFMLIPLVLAVVLSVQRTDGFGTGEFAGAANYARLAADPVSWRAGANTVVFAAIVTPLAMAGGLALALLLNSALPARGLFRSAFIVPMAVSGVATALIGVLMFDQSVGVLNLMLRAIGLSGVSWQTSGPAAFASIVLMTLWWRVGFNMLLYLAGLQGVSPELLEAARLDGAGAWKRLVHVTVPMLRSTSLFLVVLNAIYSFQVFDLVFVMTEGGPGTSTTVLVSYAYDTAFVTRDQGYAAAIGVVLLVVTLTFTAIQWRVGRRREVAG